MLAQQRNLINNSTGNMQKTINLSKLSLCAAQLQMRFNDTPLSTGTCFFWEQAGRTYLVTNWHNLTGRNARTLAHLDAATCAEPNVVVFRGFRDRNLNQQVECTLQLYRDDSPGWFEHPTFRNRVDVACIEIPQNLSPHVFPINQAVADELLYQIADDVFVLGFPLGLSIETTPIWKRASVASEPDFDIDGLPLMYIDTASSKGMSGSPVIRRALSGPTSEYLLATFQSPSSTFVGIYSGRVVASKSLEAQLGLVWKRSAIEEIIGSQILSDKDAWTKF